AQPSIEWPMALVKLDKDGKWHDKEGDEEVRSGQTNQKVILRLSKLPH
ncbi:unnamed protein product, partial [Allacma fusca]